MTLTTHVSSHAMQVKERGHQMDKLFTIDDQGDIMENASLAVVLEANEDGFSQDEIDGLNALAVGETFAIGVHAGWALFTRTK